MTLLTAWLLFPLLLSALALGVGLLLRKLSAGALPGVLLFPTGLAGVVVVTQILTFLDATAELATPAVLLLAVAGVVVSLSYLRRLRVDWWAAGAAVPAFLVFAAPFVLTGEATFGGYTQLGDTAVHFVSIDHVMSGGRDVSGLAPSSYELVAENYVDAGYPLGAQTALGAVRPLVGLDVAWTFQPFLAFLAPLMALAIYSLISPLVPARPLRALVAFTASLSPLVYGYYLQGSIKEVAAAGGVVLVAALIWTLVSAADSRAVRVIPLAVASAATVAYFGVAVAVWLGPLLLAALAAVAWAQRLDLRRVAQLAGVFVLLALPMSIQAVATASEVISVSSGVLSEQSEGGNLLRPLSVPQTVGTWLTGDFRALPLGADLTKTYFFIGVGAAAALLGVFWAARQRSWAALLYFGATVLGSWYVISRGSPWADAKALVVVAPAVLMMALLGPMMLLTSGRRIEGGLLMGLVVTGVMWSTALAYHDVNLAPRDRLAELESLGHRLDGQGPLLYTEFEEFGKHFLRDADPEGASDIRRRFLPLRGGKFAPPGNSTDTDQFTLRYLRPYRTLVLRRSPSASRPPSNYRLAYRGEYYEAWQRPEKARARVLEHLSLGNRLQPAERPRCSDVTALSRRARESDARIAFVRRQRMPVLIPSRARHPLRWGVDPRDRRSLIPNGQGTVAGSIQVPATGNYDVWLQGSFGRGIKVLVDRVDVGEARYQLNGRDQYARLGRVHLAAGRHKFELLRGGGDLHPGNGGMLRRLGPLVLSPLSNERRRVEYRGPAHASDLCRLQLDWIEAVKAS